MRFFYKNSRGVDSGSLPSWELCMARRRPSFDAALGLNLGCRRRRPFSSADRGLTLAGNGLAHCGSVRV